MPDDQGTPNPETAALLTAVAASGLPPLHRLPPHEARQAFEARVRVTNMSPERVERIDDLRIPNRHHQELSVRFYRGAQVEAAPLVLYFHGGGFVVGSIETHDSSCRYIAARSGWLVASVDYRL